MLERLKTHLLPSLTLLILLLAIYGQTLHHDFLSNWDDHSYVTRNETIRGFSAEHLKAAFTSLYVGNYAPVQIVSYMADYTLWGLRPAGFHFTNLLLHALNGILCYLLVIRVCGQRRWAFMATAIFLLHPVQVESVAWVSQRKNLLAMFFFLAALLSYVAYRRRDEQGKYTLYALSLVLFCVALLAKSVAVILPLVLICYDVCCEPRPRRGLVTDKILFFAVAAVMAVLTIVVQSPEMGGGRTDYHGGSLLATCFTMLPVLVRYLGMLVWPANLSALYLPPIRTGIDPAVAGAFLVFIALFAAGILLFRRDRQLFFGYALFFLGLLPVSQAIPLVTLMNDRYLYFPLIGAGWLAGGIVSRLLAASSTRKRMLSRAATALVLLVLTSLSWQRAAVWNNSITLWSDTVKKLPDSREAFAALAESYVNAGKSQEALRAYEEVFAFRSDFIEPIVERKALNNAAALYMDFGRFDEARPLLLTLVEKFPDYAPGFINLGYCRFVDRNLPAAEQAYRAALALEPGNTSVLMGLGNISLETRRTDAARKYYDAALANGGNGPDLQYNLACLEAATSHPAEALRHLEEALQLGYRNRDALLNNPELAPLRALPAFKRLMATYFAGTVAP